MSDLIHQHCVPCEGGTAPLTVEEETNYLSATPGWQVNRESVHQLERELVAENFEAVLELVRAIGTIAEAEGHHPNLYIHSYKKLKIELYTHAIKGLSVNDFILAAKINELASVKKLS